MAWFVLMEGQRQTENNMKTTLEMGGQNNGGRDRARPSAHKPMPSGGPRSVVAGSRETKWKVAAVVGLVGLLALTMQVWRARSGERFCAEQARRAVAQMQQQAAGAGNFLVAKNVPVPCFW